MSSNIQSYLSFDPALKSVRLQELWTLKNPSTSIVISLNVYQLQFFINFNRYLLHLLFVSFHSIFLLFILLYSYFTAIYDPLFK